MCMHFTVFIQVVWPSLAVVGGIDAGFCLGRSCVIDTNGDQITATLAGMVPDSETRVVVQELVTTDTAKVKKRCVCAYTCMHDIVCLCAFMHGLYYKGCSFHVLI